MLASLLGRPLHAGDVINLDGRDLENFRDAFLNGHNATRLHRVRVV